MDLAVSLPKIRPIEAIASTQDNKPVYILRDPFRYSDAVLTLSPYGALIVQLLDGRNSILDIQAVLSRTRLEIFSSDKIMEVVRVLDECFFLDNDRFAQHKGELEGAFARAEARPSHLAGRSYPADPSGLRSFLAGLFAQAQAPEHDANRNGVVGIVSPHIDFGRGGVTYVPAYRSIASSDADTFIVLGISHVGASTPLIPTRKSFETPLGRVDCDIDILDRVDRELAGKPGWENPYCGEFAHAFEHSIEFQVVFLQYVRGHKPFKIVPILCAFSHDEVESERNAGGMIIQFLAALRAAVEASRKKVAYVAGVDFAHVGAQFGDDFRIGPKELAFHRERDSQMMALLAAAGPADFHEFIREEANSRRVCGYPALYSFLTLLPEDARTGGQILKYGQWPDPAGTVTFGSLAFAPVAHAS